MVKLSEVLESEKLREKLLEVLKKREALGEV
jgi:hypothetical protein